MKLFTRQASLSARLLLIIAVVAIGLAALTVTNALDTRAQQMQSLEHLLRTHVESAISVVRNLNEQVTAGKISQAEAEKIAWNRLDDIRWNDGTGYVYAFDNNYINQMSPLRPQDVGTNMKGFTDFNGKHFFQHIHEIDLKKGDGLTFYKFKKPGTDHAIPKVTYSQYFKPWKMHFVSGAYFDDINNQFIHTLIMRLVQAFVVGFLMVLVIWLTMRSIRRSIGGEPALSAQLVNRMADGDLTIDGADKMELPPGSMMHAMQRLHIKLIEVMGSVQRGTNVVGTAAQEIARGNDDLSQRTQEQAANLQETAASMEEMTSTVKQNADNASQANQLVDGARKQAEQGSEVMEQAVAAMGDINTSSGKIVDIVAMIDDIAFQTNLLALNASVEAARAGEQGRGFAVVAGEVRTLSQRSAAAAKDIKTLIDESVNRVEAGSKLVHESGDALRGIVDSVKKVNDIVAEISTASQEQSTGIDQVNQAVTEMDSMTQQNASLVDEVASAAQDMQHQTEELKRQVAYFRLGTEQAAAPARPKASAARLAPPKPIAPRHVKPASQPVLATATDDGDWTEF